MGDVYSEKSKGSANGWNWIFNSPKWHYFQGGRSICGKWLGIGLGETCDDDPETDDSPDNCLACTKKVINLRAKAQKAKAQKPVDADSKQA